MNINNYLLIGGDIAPVRQLGTMIADGNLLSVVSQDVQKLVQQAAFSIFNLESPLSDDELPILKQGISYIAPTAVLKGLTTLGVSFVSLANNHILDQSAQGLLSTLGGLHQHGIVSAGAGNNLEEASKPHILKWNGLDIGVYCCAEHEFSIADEQTPGANPFDPLESLDHIATLKENVDYVIVLHHGGKEYYPYPSPNLQKTCRKMVEKGADLVVCQHSHCIGCEEKYKSGTIVYGQGDFLSDSADKKNRSECLLIRADRDTNGQVGIKFLPIVKHDQLICIPSKNESRQIFDGYHQRSEQIKQEGFIGSQYRAFAGQMLPTYLLAFSGYRRNFFFKAINKLSGRRLSGILMKYKYKIYDRLAIRNIVECEVHRELLLKGLEHWE